MDERIFRSIPHYISKSSFFLWNAHQSTLSQLIHVSTILSNVLGRQVKYLDLNHEAIFQGAVQMGVPGEIPHIVDTSVAVSSEISKIVGEKRLSSPPSPLPIKILVLDQSAHMFCEGCNRRYCYIIGIYPSDLCMLLVTSPFMHLPSSRSCSLLPPLIPLLSPLNTSLSSSTVPHIVQFDGVTGIEKPHCSVGAKTVYAIPDFLTILSPALCRFFL